MDKKNQPQVPETIIVELKEENSNAVSNGTNAGSYKVVLDEPILIENGDSFSIKSVFIDSNVPEEGLIEVKPAKVGDNFRDCSITTGFYLMNIPSSLETTFKIDTPADADFGRMCISKVYDPILAFDPADAANFHAAAGRGFTSSDTNGLAPNTIAANTQTALNSRMDGKPYVAMKAVKHSAGDPTTHNQIVTQLEFAVDSLNAFPPAQPPHDLTFKFLYYPSGAAGTGAKQQSFTLKLNFSTATSDVINKFLGTKWQRRTFADDDGTSSIKQVLTLTNDLFDSKNELATMFAGSTCKFPFHKNDQRIFCHIQTPAVPPFAIAGVVLADTTQSNSPQVGIKTTATADGTPFSLIPITRTTNFKLECRKYVPDELAKIVSQKMSSVTSVGELNTDNAFLSNNGVMATSRGLTIEQNPHLTETNIAGNNGATTGNRGDDTYATAGVTTPVIFARTLQTDPTTLDEKPEFVKINNEVIVDTFRMNDMNTNSLNYIIGSQNFAIEYDEEAQKFSFTSLHTPLYDLSDGTSGSGQVRQYKRSAAAADATPALPVAVAGLTPPAFPVRASGERFWVNKYSGVYITELEPPDLFYRSGMNFSESGETSIITDVAAATLCKDRNGQTMAVHGVPFDFKDGVNVTGDFDGVGAIVQRITPHFTPAAAATPHDNKIRPINFAAIAADAALTDYNGQYQLYDVALQIGQNATHSQLPPPYLSANEDRQVGIFAADHIQNNQYQQVDNPYYKVEVKSKLKNNIEGDPSKNQYISAIISKYYSSGNYTSAYNEGSIVYNHRGTSELLNEFSVSILDNNGNLASDISTKNTVFLEIIKSNFT